MSAPSAQTCPHCQLVIDEPGTYCSRCGAELGGLATADTQWPRAPEAEALATTLDEKPHGRRASDYRRDTWLGQVVDNRYRVIEVIGRGGMGVVYKVEHQRMSKIAAMKVLHHELDHDPEVVERFRREAEAVSRLTHPNTVQVFDFGAAQGALYLIMEYVRGQNLGVLTKRDGPFPFVRAAPLFIQICAALAEAHDLGVVHRDLKPENVLVTRTHRGRDFIKVLDFGLAKLGEREEPLASSQRGSIIGTPYYMSPEQIRGEDVDARADIYSLGALMYRVLTGQPAFTAKTPVGVVTQHLTAVLVPPSVRAGDRDIPPRVDEIVARAMAKKREDRFATIGEMLEALEAALMETTSSASTTGIAGIVSWSESARHQVLRGTLDDDEVDYGMLTTVRLQRSDLDAFERSLKRQFWLRIGVVPLIVAMLAAAVVLFMLGRAKGPQTSEQEPNNELDEATLIAPGTEVKGYLGQRVSKAMPDHDYFRVRKHGPGHVATVAVSALPNIDIEVSLLDVTGRALAHVDEGGVDQGERIHRVRVMDAVHVLVTEAMPPEPRLPTENVSDAYTVRVVIEPEQAGWEIEPNENTADAVRLAPGTAVTGYLDRRGDVDSYRLEGAPGRYQLSIDGAADVPLVWKLDDQAGSEARQATVELGADTIIRLGRKDRDLAHDEALPGIESAYTIRLLPLSP